MTATLSPVRSHAPVEVVRLETPVDLCSDLMAWTAPAYTRGEVDRAGHAYVARDSSSAERELARVVINNWRSSHSYPLNTWQTSLRRLAPQVDRDPTVAQRIKRLPSIQHKLDRIPGMKLSRMQDIGGCRGVFSSAEVVREVVAYYTEKSRIKHRLIRHDPYIDEPRDSGYRGVHLVYRYNSDRVDAWNGLSIELQLRSQLQHAWATAVETVGTFTGQALKSSWGEADWLRFFAVMSSVMALREGTPLVPGTPTDRDSLVKEVRRYARSLNVIARLDAFGAALRYAEERIDEAKGQIFLLELDVHARLLNVRSYDDASIAADAYGAVERAVEGDPNKDVVLVNVESLDFLRKAYPNYFLDTSVFVEAVQEAIA